MMSDITCKLHPAFKVAPDGICPICRNRGVKPEVADPVEQVRELMDNIDLADYITKDRAEDVDHVLSVIRKRMVELIAVGADIRDVTISIRCLVAPSIVNLSIFSKEEESDD
jgi:hypothetical protein